MLNTKNVVGRILKKDIYSRNLQTKTVLENHPNWRFTTHKEPLLQVEYIEGGDKVWRKGPSRLKCPYGYCDYTVAGMGGITSRSDSEMIAHLKAHASADKQR